MSISKLFIYVFASTFVLLCACSDDIKAPAVDDWNPDAIFITVDMDSTPQSRVSYSIEPNYFDGGNLKAKWEKGDIIKVYEAKEDKGTLTNVYKSYEDYEKIYEFPAAPVYDKYYRFECVGGVGTSHGIFKYIGLATVTVIGGVENIDKGFYNVNIDVTYNQKINNWHEFDGVIIYGNPMRNYMMRHQTENGNFSHLKYGQRMKGHLCNYNFANWSNSSDNSYGYTDRFILYNTASCIYKIVMDGFEDEIYGGAKLSLTIPGVTMNHKHPTGSSGICYRNYPMSLTLGDSLDHQERRNPWCDKMIGTNTPSAGTKQITAYVVGWPGTCPKNSEIKVELQDKFYGKIYTWTLKKSEDIVFEEGYYYTFQLTDGTYNLDVKKDPSIQTTP